MPPSSPLETLSELSREARDSAGQALASERRAQQQVASQCESLDRYRLEYAQRLQEAMRRGIDPATLRNYQRFLASLDEAIARARHTHDDQRQRVDDCQRQWQQQQQRLSSYDVLLSRRQAQRQRREQRQEQRHNDELSANGRLRRGPDHRGL